MRVLFVATFHENMNGRMFYGTTRKLANGLTRNDCNVFAFNDREIIRNSAPFKVKPIGRKIANRRLLETVENFKPDVVFLHHADTVEHGTLEEIRRRPERPRIGLINVDPLFIEKNLQNINRYGDLIDAIFVTTAGDALSQFARPATRVSFMPNPLDISIESHRAFENPAPEHDLFYATRYTRFARRIEFCMELKQRLPEVRFDFRGFDGKPSVFGWRYGAALNQCRMGLNLDKETGWHLYSSARMAQYTGNGLLTFVDRSSNFDGIYGDGELAFYGDLDELAARVRHYKHNDDEARAVAERGWAKSHAIFNSTLIARFLLDVTLDRGLTADYAWPTTIY